MYYITLPYDKSLHLALLLRAMLPCKGRIDTISFVFDKLLDYQSDILIELLKN